MILFMMAMVVKSYRNYHLATRIGYIVLLGMEVVSTITSGFILAYGYIKQEKIKKLGKFILIMAIIITLCGMLNPKFMSMGLNIMGLTERLVIYSLQIMIFVLSIYYIKCDK
ncbi:hypothetical protein [Terrisporobacter sp.]